MSSEGSCSTSPAIRLESNRIAIPLCAVLNLSIADLNAGSGYLFLFCGWGLLFWQPFALQCGERPTYLISVAVTMALTVWGPYAQGNGQWIARNVLVGFFLSPIEALPEISVADVFCAHERGTYMGAYAFALAGAGYFAPASLGVFCCWRISANSSFLGR